MNEKDKPVIWTREKIAEAHELLDVGYDEALLVMDSELLVLNRHLVVFEGETGREGFPVLVSFNTHAQTFRVEINDHVVFQDYLPQAGRVASGLELKVLVEVVIIATLTGDIVANLLKEHGF